MQGMKLLAIFAIAVISAFSASAAEACRLNRPPSDRVQSNFDAVALGVVTRSEPVNDGRGWKATVRITQPVEGDASDLEPLKLWHEIGRSGDGAACDDGQSMPQPGETWVLYFWQSSRTRGLVVSQSYPLSLARRIDRRFLSWEQP